MLLQRNASIRNLNTKLWPPIIYILAHSGACETLRATAVGFLSRPKLSTLALCYITRACDD